MPNLAFSYAFAAGVSLATYVVAARLGSSGVHPILGTAIVTGVAFFINVALMLSFKAAGTPMAMAFSMKSACSLMVVGVATAAVNLFTLLAYAHGLRVTSSFVIGGTSTVLVLLAGFLFLEERVTWRKLVAIGLVTAGTILLQRAEAPS